MKSITSFLSLFREILTLHGFFLSSLECPLSPFSNVFLSRRWFKNKKYLPSTRLTPFYSSFLHFIIPPPPMDSIIIQIEDADHPLKENVELKQKQAAGNGVDQRDVELGNIEGVYKDREGRKSVEEAIRPMPEAAISSFSTEQLLKDPRGPEDTAAGHHSSTSSTSKRSSDDRSSFFRGQLFISSVLHRIGSFLTTTKVFWLVPHSIFRMVVFYTIFGAYLFIWLEMPTDLDEKRKAYEYHLVVRDALLFKIERIHEGRILERTQHWKEAILEFEQHSGMALPQLNTSWTFWMSILYCATIYTTVGYGNIACVTTGGRVATILYAICGIPLMIVVLDQLGTFLLRKMKELSYFLDDLLFFLGVKYHLVRLDDQDSFVRYLAICRTLARFRLIPSTITLSITADEEDDQRQQSTRPSSISSLTSSRTSSMAASRMCPIGFQERRSMKIAISKGTLLDNIGPFYIESIDIDTAKRLLLSPSVDLSAPSRRLSKTSTIHLKLTEADEILANPPEKSPAHSAPPSQHSAEGKESNTSKAAQEWEQKSPLTVSSKTRRSPPLMIALIVTTGWIAFAAAVFCLWEEWSYFTSVYFFFISMSTIGFGDVTPQHPQYMIMTFFVVVVGLSLVSVCISVVQEKVSQVYMDFLNKMLEQYMKAKASGDVEALKGAMAGFNDRCKYLMPFISKNQGIRIMNQFKEEAKAMGVELPEVMTELNQETGKPTFCKIFDEKSGGPAMVDQFLEKAQQQGKMRRNAHTQTRTTPMPKAHKFFISKAEADKEEFQVQTEQWGEPRRIRSEMGSQTTEEMTSKEKSDSGIQSCAIMVDQQVGLDHPSMMDSWMSTLPPKPTRNTGVQPEVSCIMRIIDEDESDFALSDYEEEEADFSSSGLSGRLGDPLSSSQQSQLLSGSSREGDGLERHLSVGSRRSLQMKRVAEIELDEGAEHGEIRAVQGPLSPPPLVTIRMASKAATEAEEENGTKKKMMKKEGKRRMKMREAGLRYLKNAAIQVEEALAERRQMEDFSAQIGCPLAKIEEKAVSAEQIAPLAMVDAGSQYDQGKADEWIQTDEGPGRDTVASQTTESHTVQWQREGADPSDSYESADDWRTSIGTQTENKLPQSSLLSKRVQTENAPLQNRQMQTQLTSTFRRTVEGGRRDEEEQEEEEKRKMEEMSRMLGVEGRDIEVLREKMKEMKRKKMKKKEEEMGGDESEETEEKFGEEERMILMEEVRKLRRKKKMEEEEKEEEEEEENDGIREGRRKEFTLQISQPAEKGHIVRENYEETILDIQLLRSPHFETHFLPQSEERMIRAEVKKRMREPKKRKSAEEEAEAEEEIEKLLEKLSKMEDEGRRKKEKKEGDEGEVEGAIGQFTAESWAQTAEEMGETVELVEDLIRNNPEMTKAELRELIGSITEFRELREKRKERKWHKWTQTGEEQDEEEEELGRKREEKGWKWKKDGRGKKDEERGGGEGDEEESKVEEGEETGGKKEKEEEIGGKKEKEEEIGGKEQEEPSVKKKKDEEAKGKKEVEGPMSDKKKGMVEKIVRLWGSSKSGGTSKRKANEEERKRGDEAKMEELKEGKGQKEEEMEAKKGAKVPTKGPPKAKKIEKLVEKFEKTEEMMEKIGRKDEAEEKPEEKLRVPLDLSQIVLVQARDTAAVEPRKIHPIEGASTESELVPLDPDELAQFAALFPGLIEQDQQPGSMASIGTLQYEWQSSVEGGGSRGEVMGKEQKQQKMIRKEREGKKMIRVMHTGDGGQIQLVKPDVEKRTGRRGEEETEEIELIPLANLMTAEGEQKQSAPRGIRPWPNPPRPREYGQLELEYYRKWIEHMLRTARERAAPHAPYNVPLRDISEFLREKQRHEEIGEWERQKRQMERIAELGALGQRADRMVEVSIQTGIHSRVVPILGQSGSEMPGTSADIGRIEEINYLANPLYPITRIPLRRPPLKKAEDEEEENGSGKMEK